MKRLLITGANGTLGQALVTLFDADSAYTVIALDRPACDITQPEAVARTLDTHQPDIVINAAALNAVDDIETDDAIYEAALSVNAHAPGILARACRDRDIVFVHYSTDYVFSGDATDGYVEDAAVHPLSRYATTKLKGEQAVMDAGGSYYLIRVSRLYGAPGGGDGSKRSFVDLMLHLAKTRDQLDVVDDQYSAPTYAPDAARYTKILLEDERYPTGIYHGANMGGCSWYEWAEQIFSFQHIDITLNRVPATHFPRPAQAPMHSVLLNTKGPTQRSWQEALEEYLRTI